MKAVVITAVVVLAGPARADAPLPAEVEAAARASLTVAGARLVPVSYTQTGMTVSGCRPTNATLPHPIEGSGRYAVKLAGGGCRGWAWLRVDVFAPVPVLTRAVHEGEALEPAVALVERPVSAGGLPAVLPPGAVAARALPRGRALTASDVRQTASGSGAAVKVVVRAGALAIETTGRMVACGAGRACAVLASGKHVEGHLDDGRLVVEVP